MKIAVRVNENNCRAFLDEHPKIKEIMQRKYVGKNILKRYCKCLTILNSQESELADYSETITSPTFGTKTFYKWNWNGVTGWAELFQYIENQGS